MKELIITDRMRKKINDYLGYELIKRNEVGHHIYDEAPGLGKIGIEGLELEQVVTNKQMDSNGNIEWFKNVNPNYRKKEIKVKPFHCKLTTVSAKKAKILIASLFPEEATGEKFIEENGETIRQLRDQLKAVNKKIKKRTLETKIHIPPMHQMGPNEMLIGGAYFYITGWELGGQGLNRALWF